MGRNWTCGFSVTLAMAAGIIAAGNTVAQSGDIQLTNVTPNGGPFLGGTAITLTATFGAGPIGPGRASYAHSAVFDTGY